jgi:hypothetical protein
MNAASEYDIPEATSLERKIKEAEEEGESEVSVGRAGDTRLALAAAKVRVAELRASVHADGKAMRSASQELLEFEPSFPELGLHLGSGNLWISSELLSLWYPNWTTQTFEVPPTLEASPSNLQRVSRNCVYRAHIGPHEFALKQYMLKGEALRTCVKEALLLKRLQHPHIAELVGMFWDATANSLFLMMPWYENGQLDEWAARMPAPDKISLRRVLSQVLLALTHIHSHRIVHTDIKPANILITAEGAARLADFDISVDSSTRCSTAFTGTRFAFTRGFEAPELGTVGATIKTDMFSFGRSVEAIKAEGSTTLVNALCQHDPKKRPTAYEALRDPFFAPVYTWQVEQKRACCLCFESAALANGVECACRGGQHFVCDDCFDALVTSAANDDLGEIRKREGRLLCPGCKALNPVVRTFYADSVVAKHATSAAFERYNNARMRMVQQRMADEFEADLKRRLGDELKRLAAMDEEQRNLRSACHHINEELLPTVGGVAVCRCPRCKKPFIDFDGCFALTCSYCPAHFCGWCLGDCGSKDDAHKHVRTCVQNVEKGKLFSSLEKFERVQTARKKEQVLAYLGTLDIATRAAVEKEMRKQLVQVGILG